MSEVLRIARILASRDGLGNHMPDSSLKGWLGHAETMVGYVRERVADAFITASGSTVHASDCATSNAPAMEPGPCDCGRSTAHFHNELLALAHQYRNDLNYPVSGDSKIRRLAAIEAVLAKIGGDA